MTRSKDLLPETTTTPKASVQHAAVDRRRFLEIGAAASLTAAIPELSSAARAPEAGIVRPRAVIYDERFEAACRLAVSVRSMPIPVHPIRGDVTQLWYSQLYPLWKRAPVPIAGLTAYAAMFCLERLAWDQRLRMVRCASGIEPAELIAKGIGTSTLQRPRDGAVARALTAAAAGPLHLWLIASPAQLAALTS